MSQGKFIFKNSSCSSIIYVDSKLVIHIWINPDSLSLDSASAMWLTISENEKFVDANRMDYSGDINFLNAKHVNVGKQDWKNEMRHNIWKFKSRALIGKKWVWIAVWAFYRVILGWVEGKLQTFGVSMGLLKTYWNIGEERVGIVQKCIGENREHDIGLYKTYHTAIAYESWFVLNWTTLQKFFNCQKQSRVWFLFFFFRSMIRFVWTIIVLLELSSIRQGLP